MTSRRTSIFNQPIQTNDPCPICRENDIESLLQSPNVCKNCGEITWDKKKKCFTVLVTDWTVKTLSSSTAVTYKANYMVVTDDALTFYNKCIPIACVKDWTSWSKGKSWIEGTKKEFL